MKIQLLGLSKQLGKLAIIVTIMAVISYWLVLNAENLVFTVVHPTQVRELSTAYAKYHSEADKKLTETYAKSYLSPIPDK